MFPTFKKTFPHLTPEEIYRPWFKADVGALTSLEGWEALGYKGDIEKIEREYLNTIELSEGFHHFATEASKCCKLAIISNDSSRWSRYLREKFDINRYFEVISISGDLRMQKPDARIFTLAIEQLGVEAGECLYVDDREGNLEAARKVGMKTVLFNGRQVPYEGSMVTDFSQLISML